MTFRPLKSMQDMLPGDATLLAKLLSLDPEHPPSWGWLQEQEKKISSFPDSLLKPYPLLPRLAMSLSCAPDKAVLCESHQLLNSRLIHQIFLEVSAECTTRQTRLEQNTFRSPLISNILERLHRVTSFWVTPDAYCDAFQATSLSRRYKCISSGCEACILASIGGNHGILSDLRASILGRKKHGHPASPLLPLVEAWINQTPVADSIRADSEILKKEIRRCRRQMQKARRQERRNITGDIFNIPATYTKIMSGETTLVNEEILEFEDLKEKDENDAEGSIIDYYANRLSFLPGDDHTEAVHPAFSNSVIFCPTTGTFQKTIPTPESAQMPAAAQRQSAAYSESVYDAQASRASFPRYGMRGTSADEYAEFYRKLVEMGEEEEEDERPDGRKTRRESRSWMAR